MPMDALFERQLLEKRELYAERFAWGLMRKMAAFYIKGKRDAAEYKCKLFSAQTTEEVLTLAKEIFN